MRNTSHLFPPSWQLISGCTNGVEKSVFAFNLSTAMFDSDDGPPVFSLSASFVIVLTTGKRWRDAEATRIDPTKAPTDSATPLQNARIGAYATRADVRWG